MEREMIYAPVMILACSREQHLKRCVESLQRNPYAVHTEVYISVDYPSSEQYMEGWRAVRKFLNEPIEGFKNVVIYLQQENLGFYQNAQFLYRKVYEHHDRVIFTEDDNEFSPNFLEYVDKGLMLYEKDPKVYGVCGYGYDYAYNPHGNNVIALANMNMWGCGVWRDKEKHMMELLSYNLWKKTARNPFKMIKLYRHRKRLFSRMLGILLESDAKEQIDRVDVNRGIVLTLNDWYTVSPVISKVRNWGWDGSGLHIIGNEKKQEEYENQIIDEAVSFEYQSIKLTPDIANDRLLDMNGEWNSERAKWYNDPITYFLYWLLGEKNFRRFIRREKQGK